MVILHIACITNNPCNGVCNVVPKYVEKQSVYAKVALINVNNVRIDFHGTQLDYKRRFDILTLSPPFNAPDLVVLHELYIKQYIDIYRCLIKHRIKYIVVPHGSLSIDAQNKKRVKKTLFNILFFNRLINGSLAVQCLSNQEYLKTKTKTQKILCTNGVEMPKMCKESFNEFETRFIYIGRLDAYHKGLDLLVEAISKKKDILLSKRCRFDIYGPDIKGRAKLLKELIENNDVTELVFIHHEISGAKKIQLLLASDVFIQTSRFEGMPLGIIEAMSYGLPVIATEGTCLSVFINDHDSGWGTETSSDAIAAAILQALDSKDAFFEKSRNAIDSVGRFFSWDQITKETILSYKRLVEKHE